MVYRPVARARAQRRPEDTLGSLPVALGCHGAYVEVMGRRDVEVTERPVRELGVG